MRRSTVTATLAVTVAMMVVALVPFGTISDPARTGAAPPTYEYDILPGVQPLYEGPDSPESAASRYFVSDDLAMTCGWHSSCVNPKGKIDPKNDQKIIDRYGQEYSTENYSLSTLPHGDDWKYT